MKAVAEDGDTIVFAAALDGQTINLTSAELVIDKNVTISGPGPSARTVSRDSQALISNDDWRSDPVSAGQLSLHGLALQDSTESGIFTSLPPGAFTAILAGKNGGAGIGLVEVYKVH